MAGPAASPVNDPCRLALAAVDGDTVLDKSIAEAQQRLRSAHDPAATLEQLGWLFVSKARASFDPGYYKLAEQCALCLDSRQPRSEAALLLRGHVLQNLHHFKEAEPLARELTVRRGAPFDFGLLGDVLMEQGRLEDAAEAYQRMMDLRPSLHAYARGAHLRWLKGDLAGAVELMQMAVGAASPLDAEAAAWVHTRLAIYQLQSGAYADVERHCAAALEYQTNCAPALLCRGKLLLAVQQPAAAVVALAQAVELNPLPEYQWILADTLRTTQRTNEAQAVEARLHKRGAAADPRTFALFLATRGKDSPAAVRLARAELENRQDIFTHDALGWALAADGQWDEAAREIRQALAEGTEDGRLSLHAGIILMHAGERKSAARYLSRAAELAAMLLPSERQRLAEVLPESGKISFPLGMNAKQTINTKN